MREWRRREEWQWILLLAVLLVAAVVVGRPLVELDRFGEMGYDQTVYFLGGVALLDGHVPYDDFAFVHPPGVLLALAPFAPFDTWGFTAAKMAWVGLAVGSTAMVWRLGRHWLGPVGAVVGAATFALYRPTINTHRHLLLEPLVVAAVLAAPMAYAPWRATRSQFRLTAVGALLALAVVFKYPAVVAVISLLLALQLDRARRADLPRVLFGFLAGVVLLLAPFVLAVGGSFFEQTVVEQLGRERSVDWQIRLLSSFWPAGSPPLRYRAWAACLVLAVLTGLIIWGWLSRSLMGRMAAGWLAFGITLTLSTSSFYEHYALVTAPPVALLAAGFITSSRAPSSARSLLFLALAAGAASAALRPIPPALVQPAHAYAGSAAAADKLIPAEDCVITDAPETALVVRGGNAWSVATGPTVDPVAEAFVADTSPPVAPESTGAFVRSLSRCAWFAAPWWWSPTDGYPGWSSGMQHWFDSHYRLVAAASGTEFWHRTERGK